MMRRRARRYWGGLLVVVLLIIPAYSSDTPVGPAAAPVRFLATAEVLSREIQTLSSFVTESPILLPIMRDLARWTPPAAHRRNAGEQPGQQYRRSSGQPRPRAASGPRDRGGI